MLAPRRAVLLGLLALVALIPSSLPAQGADALAGKPHPVRHIFVINLENKGYDETFGPSSPAPYLSHTLRAKGQLLTQYFGIGHKSLPNYIAQVSGQAPNPQTQGDCQLYSDFVQAGTVAPQQAVGNGCVYPANVKTVADQLHAKGLTWRGYMEDMGAPCRHPPANTQDDTQQAEVGDQYAARHNPFVYFKSLTGSSRCKRDVVGAALPAGPTWRRPPRPATSPTSPRTCATTRTTRPASTDAPGGWCRPTAGCAPGCRGSSRHRRSGRTDCSW